MSFKECHVIFTNAYPKIVTVNNRPFAARGHVLGYWVATQNWRASIPAISSPRSILLLVSGDLLENGLI